MYRFLFALFFILSCHHQDPLTFYDDSDLPEKTSKWKVPPIVVNCTESNYTRNEVAEVIHHFEQKNHRFLGLIEFQCKNLCKHMDGVIFIQPEGCLFELGNDSSAYGYTLRETEPRSLRKDINLSAIIETKNSLKGFSKMLTLQHELGHALGYGHTSIPGHLMNEYYELGGTNMDGMKIRKKKY